MSSVIIDKNPRRYACGECGCEVSNGPVRGKRCIVPDNNGSDVTIVDGVHDPIIFDPDCVCPCHHVWLMINARIPRDAIPAPVVTATDDDTEGDEPW